MNHQKADPRAILVAQRLLKATGADCIILLGSRARGDWTDQSDLDLMVLNEDTPEQPAILEIQRAAAQLSQETLGRYVQVDVIPMSHNEFRKMGYHTINHVAARARREGITIPGDRQSHRSRYGGEHPDGELEYLERQRHIGDANLHYRSMHALLDLGLLDLGLLDKNTVLMARKAMENAMMAMISALGAEYHPHHHVPGPEDRARALADDIQGLDPGREWRFASNLEQLDGSDEACRRAPVATPTHDHREMANNLTLDLIYGRISAITGEKPWEISPESSSQAVAPIWRNQ